MRHTYYVYTAAALTAALAFDGSALGDTITPGSGGGGGVTVAATWRAQPAAIEQGATTTFKLSLRALGDDGVSAISFADSNFTFSSGSAGSIPTSADMILNATARSAGATANAMLAPLQVTYFEEGIHDATVHTSGAGISWMADGVEHSGMYALDLGTKVAVGGSAPNLQSVSVPLLIGVGESFGFSALAESGLTGSLTYQWDFDFDGTFTSDSQQQAPSYAYDTAGVHTGMLRVTGDNGYVVPLQFTVNAVTELGAPVPLPAAVWGGLGLMIAFGVVRALSASRVGGARPA
jgi:hypothetical protein